MPRANRAILAGAFLFVLASCAEDEGGFCRPPAVELGGGGCTVTWDQCSGAAAFVAQCTRAGESADFECTCVENTVKTGTFTAEGFCQQSQLGMTSAVNTGCGWQLRIK